MSTIHRHIRLVSSKGIPDTHNFAFAVVAAIQRKHAMILGQGTRDARIEPIPLSASCETDPFLQYAR